MKVILVPQIHNEDHEKGSVHHDKAENQAWSILLNAPGFLKYIDQHGWHFTNELAEFASNLMVNADGHKHTWTVKYLIKDFLDQGYKLPKDQTWGDITYLANMAYADFYPELCKTDKDCLKYAYLVATDVDGYEGMAFYRWISDVIGNKLVIDWDKFI